jgi:hypothetical protein
LAGCPPGVSAAEAPNDDDAAAKRIKSCTMDFECANSFPFHARAKAKRVPTGTLAVGIDCCSL